MSHRTTAPVVGIVGGIGSGKSSIARLLAESMPVVVIDGDRAGHEVLERPEIIDRLRRRFGDSILDSHGNIDRAALGRAVFGTTEDRRRGRADLERIVHPRIRETLETEIAAARARPQVAAIVLDAAVLFEAGWNDLCDAVVYIDTPRQARLERVWAGRGWDAAELDRREASQLSLETKRAAAQRVIDNSGLPSQAAASLADFVKTLIERTDVSR